MSASKTIAGAAVLMVVGLCLVRQHLENRRLRAETETLRQQVAGFANAREEQEELKRQIAALRTNSQNDTAELARLRAEITRARQTEKENAALRAQRERAARIKVKQASGGAAEEMEDEQTPEQRLQRAKGFFGRDLGLGLLLLAEANHGKLPTDLNDPVFQIIESLSSGSEYGFRAKAFELVYQGSMNDLKPGQTTILAREREPVQRPDGKWVRLYVLADGSSQFIAADAANLFSEKEARFWPQQIGSQP